jgi:sulfur-carrier protein
MIRVELPAHLRTLAHVSGDVMLDVPAPVTIGAVLDALESAHPVLRGTVRDQLTGARRPFIRFFACEEDLSREPPDRPLPAKISSGEEPLVIIGAIAGGEDREL